jgi:hypothetical protein
MTGPWEFNRDVWPNGQHRRAGRRAVPLRVDVVVATSAFNDDLPGPAQGLGALEKELPKTAGLRAAEDHVRIGQRQPAGHVHGPLHRHVAGQRHAIQSADCRIERAAAGGRDRRPLDGSAVERNKLRTLNGGRNLESAIGNDDRLAGGEAVDLN